MPPVIGPDLNSKNFKTSAGINNNRGQAINFVDCSFYSTQSSTTVTTYFSTAQGYDSSASSTMCPLKKESPMLKEAFVTLIQMSTKLIDANWDKSILQSCMPQVFEAGNIPEI